MIAPARGRVSRLSSKFSPVSFCSRRFEANRVTRGNSTTLEELNKPPPKSTAEKWAEVPTAAKVGIYCGAAAGGIILIVGFVFFFIKQRQRGRLEHALNDAKWNGDRTDLTSFQPEWKQTEVRHNGYQPVA